MSKSREGTPDIWGTGEIAGFTAALVTYVNIFIAVGFSKEDGRGFYECRVFTTEQSGWGEMRVRMRNFGQHDIDDNDVMRLELMGIADALRYAPRLCAVIICVSSEEIEKAINGFNAAPNKKDYPNADLLYPICTSDTCYCVTVCPSPFSPILEFCCDDAEVEKLLAKQFRDYMVQDMAENAELGKYAATDRPDYDYVYEMTMPVYGEMFEDLLDDKGGVGSA